MRIRSFAAIAAGALVTSLIGLAMPAPAGAEGGVPLQAHLTGAAEVPGPGDPDGSGDAQLTVNPGLEQVCYSYTTSGLSAIVGAHVHRGTVTESGAVVIPLSTTGSGCATADRALLREIVQDPAAFYVNVHTTEFGPGAIRGQLHR